MVQVLQRAPVARRRDRTGAIGRFARVLTRPRRTDASSGTARAPRAESATNANVDIVAKVALSRGRTSRADENVARVICGDDEATTEDARDIAGNNASSANERPAGS